MVIRAVGVHDPDVAPFKAFGGRAGRANVREPLPIRRPRWYGERGPRGASDDLSASGGYVDLEQGALTRRRNDGDLRAVRRPDGIRVDAVASQLFRVLLRRIRVPDASSGLLLSKYD